MRNMVLQLERLFLKRELIVYSIKMLKHISDESKKVFGNLEDMPQEAQQVIVNMCFNMGAPRLSQFKKFIKAIHDEDWATASVEMLDSRWANQVGIRANRLSDRIKAIN